MPELAVIVLGACASQVEGEHVEGVRHLVLPADQPGPTLSAQQVVQFITHRQIEGGVHVQDFDIRQALPALPSVVIGPGGEHVAGAEQYRLIRADSLAHDLGRDAEVGFVELVDRVGLVPVA